jgi:hypothetical protein
MIKNLSAEYTDYTDFFGRGEELQPSKKESA